LPKVRVSASRRLILASEGWTGGPEAPRLNSSGRDAGRLVQVRERNHAAV